MAMDVFASFIIPAYNVEKYIVRALTERTFADRYGSGNNSC